MEKRVASSLNIIITVALLIIVALFIGKTFTGNVVQDTCKAPYTFIGGDCCLDKDNNGVCDDDEAITGNVISRIVEEECEIKDRLTCAGKKIEQGLITLRLRNDKSGIFSPISIELANVGNEGCKAVFSGSVEDGFDYQQTKEYKLKCDFSEKYVDSLIIIKGTVYERSHVRGPALMPYNPLEFSADGYIKGIVE